MVELLHTRMLAFFLGSISNFLAIPVSLFGLALGSLLVRRARRVEKPDARRLITILQALVLPVLAAAFVGFFVVANTFFAVIHVSLENPYGDAARLLAYAGIFLPPYALFGALLALYFEEGAQSIGRLYFFDLAGAASGRLLAPLVLTVGGAVRLCLFAPRSHPGGGWPRALLRLFWGARALPAATPLARRRLAVGAG